MKSSAAFGTLLLTICQGPFLVFSFAIHTFLGRYLGPSSYGMFGLVMSIILWFETIYSGTNYVGSKLISEDNSKKDSIASIGILVQLIISISIILTIFISSDIITYFFSDLKIKHLLLLGSVDIPFFALLSFSLRVYNGLKQYNYQAIFYLIYIITKMISIVLLVYFGYSVKGAICGNIIGSFVSFLLAYKYLDINYSFPKNEIKKVISKLWTYGVPISLFNIIFMIIMNIDLWLLKSNLQNAHVIGYYTSSQTIARLPYFLSLGLTGAIFPAISSAFKNSNIELCQTYIRQSIRFILIIFLPICIIIYMSSEETVGLVFGKRFLPAVVALEILIWGLLFITFCSVLSTILFSTDHPMIPLIVMGGLALFDLGLNSVLIPVYRMSGAALATSITGMLGTGILMKYVYNEFKVMINFESAYKIALSIFVMIITITIGKRGEYGLIISNCIALILYFGTLCCVKEIKREELLKITHLVSPITA